MKRIKLAWMVLIGTCPFFHCCTNLVQLSCLTQCVPDESSTHEANECHNVREALIKVYVSFLNLSYIDFVSHLKFRWVQVECFDRLWSDIFLTDSISVRTSSVTWGNSKRGLTNDLICRIMCSWRVDQTKTLFISPFIFSTQIHLTGLPIQANIRVSSKYQSPQPCHMLSSTLVTAGTIQNHRLLRLTSLSSQRAHLGSVNERQQFHVYSLTIFVLLAGTSFDITTSMTMWRLRELYASSLSETEKTWCFYVN